ncbi:PH domain-containing protein [Parapedobacter pyrenivorans]|uniref:PH domain-containing protein n=1 Tax=Parapedobacter pyrenivorans TaxID=1305674 RepID=UPI00333ECFC4
MQPLGDMMNIDRYINDGQDPKVVEKLLLKLQDMLATGEQVLYVAVQKMPAMTLFPDSIAMTDKRVFFCRSTKLGFATDFNMFSWSDVLDISFKEGILGAKWFLTSKEGDSLEMKHIPKSQARKLYQWGSEALEKRQVSETGGMEGPHLKIASVAEPDDPLAGKLKKLKLLFEQQLITQEEYENKKSELLSQL